MPEVLFEVAENLDNGNFELRERFAISSSTEEAAEENIGFESPEDCIFWLGNGGYFSPNSGLLTTLRTHTNLFIKTNRIDQMSCYSQVYVHIGR